MNIYFKKEYIPRKINSVYIPKVRIIHTRKYIPRCSDKLVDLVGLISKTNNIDVVMSTMTPDQCRLISEMTDYIYFYEIKNALIVILLFSFLVTTLLLT